MISNWTIKPDAVPTKTIDEIVDFVENNYTFEKGLVNGSSDVIDHRASDIAWVGLQAGDAHLNNYIWNFIQHANRAFFGFDIQLIPSIQYTIYRSEYKGHYDWHHDTSFAGVAPYCRKLSFILQLSDSDEYEGGDFELDPDYRDDNFTKEELRAKGTAIVFPSFYKHRVTPVTKGVRRSLVAWAEGPKFR